VIMGVFLVYQNYQSLLDYSERDALTGLLNRKTFDEQFLKCLDTMAGNAHAAEGSPNWWLGVIDVESSFRTDVCSSAGACGLMQLMPGTAADMAKKLGVSSYDRKNAAFNVDAGTLYLSLMLKRYGGDEAAALAAYNAGPGNVDTWWKAGAAMPEYSAGYVAKVRAAKAKYSNLSAGDAGFLLPVLALTVFGWALWRIR